jgi:predicted O-linked N-acetylglucosamine transferase (SPINDLY family)
MLSPADLPALAARFRRFGALAQAESLYRQALEAEPGNSGLWADLGRIGHSLGNYLEAAAHFRRALDLDPEGHGIHNDLAGALVKLGRLDEAVANYHEALRLQPSDATVYTNLGCAQMRQSNPEAAAASFRQALALQGDDPVVLCHLGNALIRLGNYDLALDCEYRAVQLWPDFAHAWLYLGHALRALGRHDEAVSSYERAAGLRPGDPDPLGELGVLRMHRGELDQAVARFEQLLHLRPDCAEAYSNLGLALLGQGRLEEARLSCQQALYLRPDLAEAHNNLGLTLLNQGRAEAARRSFEQALAIQPQMADALNNLALAWNALARPDDALASIQRAIQIAPEHRGALTNLANAYRDQGCAAQAVATYRQALALSPDDAPVHSNLLLAMQYDDHTDARQICAEAAQYARQRAIPLAGAIEPRPLQPLAGRRLRIGYVSADFREHPVAYFLEPILAYHDHERVEVFCYADVPDPDTTTARLRAHADVWRSLVGLSDSQAASVIRQDDIDILVDLAGHTGGNRLLVFARKPAPIQASYLGYLGTTGLPAIDYYLSDAHADSPGVADAYYSEELIRLPECAFCYRPGPAPAVDPELPAHRSGQLVFGCLNNPAKLSDQVLALWSQVLASVPGSCLLLRAGGGSGALDRIRTIFNQHRISSQRLLLAGDVPTRFAYLDLYHTIDIGLDPFPYNGVTTTCDALWMGVPVISLAGAMGASRQGVRFLRTIGLDELLADSPEQYVGIATNLASDLTRLASLRCTLRERVSHSPLVDAQRLTRDLEAAYHGMWKRTPSAAPINP